MKDGSSAVINEMLTILCTVIDDNDSLLKSTVSPPMATIVDEEEEKMLKPSVVQPMAMILEEAENLVKDDDSMVVESEGEVDNSSDITMKQTKDVKF